MANKLTQEHTSASFMENDMGKLLNNVVQFVYDSQLIQNGGLPSIV